MDEAQTQLVERLKKALEQAHLHMRDVEQRVIDRQHGSALDILGLGMVAIQQALASIPEAAQPEAEKVIPATSEHPAVYRTPDGTLVAGKKYDELASDPMKTHKWTGQRRGGAPDCQKCEGRGEVPVYGRVGQGILYYKTCPECNGTTRGQRCSQRVVFAGLDDDESGLCGKLLPCPVHDQDGKPLPKESA